MCIVQSGKFARITQIMHTIINLTKEIGLSFICQFTLLTGKWLVSRLASLMYWPNTIKIAKRETWRQKKRFVLRNML